MPDSAPVLRIEHVSNPETGGNAAQAGEQALESDLQEETYSIGDGASIQDRVSYIPISTATINRSFDEQDHAEVQVFRDHYEWVEDRENYNSELDEFYVFFPESGDGSDYFGGRVMNVTRGGSIVELVLGDWETDMRQGRRSGGVAQYVNTSDLDIVEDAVANVPTISLGTTRSVTPAASLLYSHASPAKMIHALCESTGGEYRLNPDKTLDYGSRLGKDHVDIIGPANQNLTSEFSLEHNVQDAPTHLLVLGAGEGDYQIRSEVVSDRFDGTEGSREIWETVTNKEATSEERCDAIAETYMEEFDGSPEYIEVDADITGTEVRLGDTYPVIYEKEHIDTRLRAIDVTTVIDESGVHYETTLSNRRFTRGDVDSKTRQDVSRYNLAFEGTAVPFSDSGGRQPVTSEHNYELDVDYPSDVVQELDAKVKIDGMAYRSYSEGVAAGGGTIVNESSTSNDDFEAVVEDARSLENFDDVRGTWRTVSSFETDEDTSVLYVSLTAFQSPDVVYTEHPTYTSETDRIDAGRGYLARLYNVTRNEYHPHSGGMAMYIYGDDTVNEQFIDAQNVKGDTFRLQMRRPDSLTSPAFPIITTYSTWNATGQHTHDFEVEIDEHTHEPNPGIIEYDEFPSNCEVLVNNQPVNHAPIGDGDGPFDEIVDISNTLRSGFNSIEVSSESLGHLRATVSLDLYRQISSG